MAQEALGERSVRWTVPCEILTFPVAPRCQPTFLLFSSLRIALHGWDTESGPPECMPGKRGARTNPLFGTLASTGLAMQDESRLPKPLSPHVAE